MTKKVLFGMFAAAGLLATSCSDDELSNSLASGDYVNASFAIETPEGILTRAIGDGTQADKVACAIFYNGSELAELRDTVTVTGKKATYNVRLAKGQKYQAVFFAYNSTANAYDLTSMEAISVKDNQSSNAENRDAFTASVEVTTTNTNINQDVTLYRPFAQLNIGSTAQDIADAKAAGIEVDQTSVTVSNVYTTFNAVEDKVVGEPSKVTYNLADIPTEKLKVTVNGTETEYTYLALNYLLVGDKDAEKSLTDVEFTVKPKNGSNNTATFENVPVQRNYRTNIIGALLTNPALFNIVIDSDFDEPDYVYEVWDGKTVTTPEVTADAVLIKTASDWAGLGNVTIGNKVIKLTANIDFGGYTVKGRGLGAGGFDGQGYTMRNLVLTPGSSSNYSNGLFQGDATFTATSVKNVTIKNVKCDCSNPEHGYAGVLFGDVQNGDITFENVNVINADVKGVRSVGGIVGFVTTGRTVTLTNCSVEGSKISNYAVDGRSGYVAGLVGRPVGTVTATNCGVSNTTIDGYYSADCGESSIAAAVGGKDNTGVTVTNTTVTKTSLDVVATVASAEELSNAISDGKSEILLGEGTYTLPASAKGKTLTFVGTGDASETVIKAVKNGEGDYSLDGSTAVFENLSITVGDSNGDFNGFVRCNGTFKNCIINNVLTLYGNSTFEGCTFNVEGNAYNVWTWGAKEATFNNCTFNSDGKSMLLYGGAGSSETPTTILTINNCTFNDNGTTAYGKTAIEIGNDYNATYTLIVNNTKVYGFEQNLTTGTTLWSNKNSMDKDHLSVTVDDKKVY